MTTIHHPSTDIDIYSDAVLSEPYHAYAELRSLGPVVWMRPHDAFVITRFEEARTALRAWSVFSSASGVMMNAPMNDGIGGRALLCTDGAAHARLRRIIGAPLRPRALEEEVRAHIEAEARSVVDRLVAAGSFDAATELAEHLPKNVVSQLVGIPQTDLDQIIGWTVATFDTVGPLNDRCRASLPLAGQMAAFMNERCVPGTLRPGGWADRVWSAVDDGLLEQHEPPGLMNDYMGPSLDTTINATSNLMWLLATHPGEWARLRADPGLVPNAIDEALRMESPIQSFSRCTTEDVELGGASIPARSRVVMLFGAANRDPAAFPEPDRFDVGRPNAGDHLALGFGPHACPGGPLAKMEIRALLELLVQRCERIALLSERRRLNNIIRGFESCVVTVSSPDG